MAKTGVLYRDAGTGRIITKANAERRPKETVRETYKRPTRKPTRKRG